MTVNPNSSQVRVGVRIRPQTAKETSEGGEIVVESNALRREVSLSKRKFTYDAVFHSNVTQTDLYNNVAPPLLDSFLNGYNATILAYGQTGAGKTYTMGSEAGGKDLMENLQDGIKLNESDGLIPRFMSDLFASLFQRKEESEKAALKSPKSKSGEAGDGTNAADHSISLIDFTVSASFLEVYGDELYDILDEERTVLKMREDSNKEVVVVGLKSVPIHNAFEAMNALNTGTMVRTTAETLMNCTSSRSHAVFTVNLQQTTRSSQEGDEITTKSRFTFVDLAGSERLKKTGAEGERMQEGIKINQGLLALGNCINALADDERLAKGEKAHVPYRQSKLTRLLQDALGGNSQTLFIACVSPSDSNASESISTLHYANRARNIRNAPVRNVDATAEELRTLRTLSYLLKCELIKQRFDGQTATTYPEVERESVSAEIGFVNEALLLREDVAAYMKRIDEKVAELSGSSSNLNLSFSAQSSSTLPRDCSTAKSFFDTPNQVLESRETSNMFLGSASDTEDDHSDIDANPEQIIDELLEQQQDEEQINKLDGDIREQEDRLLQLKAHVKVYHDMKSKYEIMINEVNKLEAEKQSLAEKLEKALSDPSKGGCSLSIKTKLDQVKASLAQARQDVRKQQQKCRDAELEAQRCKGLERRIEEMKSAKANLIRKQKEDAKRQKDFSKTKAREIQILRRKERSAQKRVGKLEAECQRYKSDLDRSKTRYEKLSTKLKETETSLKKARGRKRNNASGTRRDEEVEDDCLGQFAPASPKLNSIKFVLEKILMDRVAFERDKEMYVLKAAERENLMQSMENEVKLLNKLKRERKSMDAEPSEEILAAIKDHEYNVQEMLIQTELVDSNLEELRERHPSIDDDKENEEKNHSFEEHEPALKMIERLNGPVLRTLFLKVLDTCYASELGRQTMKDELGKKDCVLRAQWDEMASQCEKIHILSKSLKSREQRGATPVPSPSHAQETENLRADRAAAEEKHFSEIERIRNDLNQSHAAAIQKVKLAQEEEIDLLLRELKETKEKLAASEQRQTKAEEQKIAKISSQHATVKKSESAASQTATSLLVDASSNETNSWVKMPSSSRSPSPGRASFSLGSLKQRYLSAAKSPKASK